MIVTKQYLALMGTCLCLIFICYIIHNNQSRYLCTTFIMAPPAPPIIYYNFTRGSMYSTDEILKYENHNNESNNPHYMSFIQTKWILKPSSEQLNLNEKGIIKDYSQVGQSTLVRELLGGKTNGFFVECGAASGELFSNSLYFELNLNWTGLLIEPNPIFFQELLRTNRKCYMSNVCLNTAPESGKQIFEQYSWWGGISSNLDNVNKQNENITIQCFPLEALLRSIGVRRVDYLSLDVEGAELAILRTIPFDKVVIDVIGVEYRVNTHGGTGGQINRQKTLLKLQEIRSFFNQTQMYYEVGILPRTGYTDEIIQANGLDVFFQRL